MTAVFKTVDVGGSDAGVPSVQPPKIAPAEDPREGLLDKMPAHCLAPDAGSQAKQNSEVNLLRK